MRPPLHLVDLVEVDGDFFAAGDGLERPGGFVEKNGVGEVALGFVSMGLWRARGRGTSRMASCPLIATLNLFFVILTSRSLPL